MNTTTRTMLRMCADSRTVGGGNEWPEPHILSRERTQLTPVKNTNHRNLGSREARNSPRRVHSKVPPKNSSPSKSPLIILITLSILMLLMKYEQTFRLPVFGVNI